MQHPIKNKNVNEMTRQDFEKLPSRKWNEDIGMFGAIIILPSRTIAELDSEKEYSKAVAKRLQGEPFEHLHDSGYRFMDFVAEKDGWPICKLAGGSDVIHIGGIGGDNLSNHSTTGFPKTVPPVAWSIDCLPKSGLLRLFAPRHLLRAGPSLSSFELYAVEHEDKE